MPDIEELVSRHSDLWETMRQWRYIWQDIADYLGLRIETVCRVLSDLKRAGMLDIPNQHQLILKDVDGLSELADSIE